MTLNFGIGPKTYLNTKPDDINDSRYPPGKNSSKKLQNLKTKEKQSKERKTKVTMTSLPLYLNPHPTCPS